MFWYGTKTLDLRLRRRLAAYTRREYAGTAYRSAVVLVPFLWQRNGWHVLFIQRSDQTRHAGQIAFPGGARDETDADIVATGVREAEEEIGIPPQLIEIWGVFDDFGPTSSGYYATPVIAQLPANFHYRPNVAEVAAIVRVPLAFFLDPTQMSTEYRDNPRLPRENYVWHYQDHRIWGLTGRILKGLLDFLKA